MCGWGGEGSSPPFRATAAPKSGLPHFRLPLRLVVLLRKTNAEQLSISALPRGVEKTPGLGHDRVFPGPIGHGWVCSRGLSSRAGFESALPHCAPYQENKLFSPTITNRVTVGIALLGHAISCSATSKNVQVFSSSLVWTTAFLRSIANRQNRRSRGARYCSPKNSRLTAWLEAFVATNTSYDFEYRHGQIFSILPINPSSVIDTIPDAEFTP